MENADHTPDARAELLSALRAMDIAIGDRRAVVEVEIAELEELERLSKNWRSRRASVEGSIDNWTHRMGSAIAAAGGEWLNSDGVLGLWTMGARGMVWLAQAARGDPDGSIVDHHRALIAHPVRGPWLIRFGVVQRWRRMAALNAAESAHFDSLDVASDLRAKWRRKQTTADQRFLVAQILEMLASLGEPQPDPDLKSRGAAYDWIKAMGGNPRFWTEPEWLTGPDA